MKRILLIVLLLTVTAGYYKTYSQDWENQTSGTTSELRSIYFYDLNNGWAVGYQGIIIHTNDGGFNWIAQTSGTTSDLNSVYFVSQTQGWAVGKNGTILTTTDGGTTWLSQTSGSTYELTAVHFVDATTGWIGGAMDVILFTSDAGVSWNAVPSGFSPSLNGLDALDANTAWAAGNSGVVITTTDGGSNWNYIATSGGITLFDIGFADASNGWVVGMGGKIFHSTDGGSTWSLQMSGTTENLTGVSVVDANNIWVVGMNGTILNTTDGGTTWNDQSDATIIEHFWDVCFLGSTGWVSGNNGKILKKSNLEEICLVTVDQTVHKNKIIWERILDQGTESYNIYKLVGSTYNLLATVPFDEMSEYIDYSSQPDVVSARYKISRTDGSGNESVQSPYHQTINLGISQGVPSTTMVLTWNHYVDESGVYAPDYYYIMRGTDQSTMTLHDSVSGAYTMYNDLNVLNLYYYAITINKPGGCVPTSTDKAQGGPYTQSFSNLEDNAAQLGITRIRKQDIFIQPNPANDYFYVTLPDTKPGRAIVIIDMLGQEIARINDVNQTRVKINTYNFKSGCYFVKVEGEDLLPSRLVID